MVHLVKCKACGHEIVKSARKCPNCGKRRSLRDQSPAGFAALMIFLVLFAIFLFLLASSDDEPTQPELSGNSNAASASVADSTPEPSPEPTFSPLSVEVSNWEITVTDFYFADNVDISWLYEYESDENAQYAIVQMTAKNIGNEADVFLPILSYGADVTAELKCNGMTFTRSEIILADDALSTKTLNPLVSASGIVVFSMPTELIESDAQIDLVISADYASNSVTLR